MAGRGDDGGGPIRRARLEGRPVAVPAKVLAAIEAVRNSGATNMLDRPAVIAVALAFGADEAADWIEAHRGGSEAACTGAENACDHRLARRRLVGASPVRRRPRSR